MPPRRKIHRHIRKPHPVLQYLPAMLEPPVVGLSARRVDGGVHRIEHPADEDRAVDRRRARAFQNARQVMKRARQVQGEERSKKNSTRAVMLKPPPSLSPNLGRDRK